MNSNCGLALACCLTALLALRPAVAIDGQSGKVSDEDAERVWNDPNCERTRGEEQGVDWDAIRTELIEVPFPETLPSILSVVRKLDDHSVMDREVALCPFGLVAVLFFFVKYLLALPEPQLETARVWYSILDGVASGMHPHLMDRADWVVKDHRIIALRRALLRHLSPPQPSSRPYVYVYDAATLSEMSASADPSPDAQAASASVAAEVLKDISQGASFCAKGQWGMEVHIHEWLLASPHLTKNPDEADFYFVPGYGICMFEGGFVSYPLLDEAYKELVMALPFFNASSGKDHIFTFGSGMSANVFRSWRTFIPSSIFLTPETWLFNDFPDMREPCFDTWKDIAIPGYLHRHEINSLVTTSRPLAEREHFAVFLGRTDPSRGPHPQTGEPDVRGMLHELHLQGQIMVAHNLSMPMMHATMGNARFCFVPKGKSAWSLRFYEALFANCVPVVLSDHWELPFEDFLDIPSFVIRWPMAHVGGEMLAALRAIPDEVIERYMAAAQAARCWYVYPPLIHEVHLAPNGDAFMSACPEAVDINAFTGIMQLLERKRQLAAASGQRFDPAAAAVAGGGGAHPGNRL